MIVFGRPYMNKNETWDSSAIAGQGRSYAGWARVIRGRGNLWVGFGSSGIVGKRVFWRVFLQKLSKTRLRITAETLQCSGLSIELDLTRPGILIGRRMDWHGGIAMTAAMAERARVEWTRVEQSGLKLSLIQSTVLYSSD